MWRKPSRAKSEIVDRMTVVCIGGNPIGCEKPGWEFNFGNDVEAANTVLHCGGDIWMIPNNVYGTMHIGFGEIQRRIAPYGEIGRLLYENLISFYETENASWSAGESWSLGDSPGGRSDPGTKLRQLYVLQSTGGTGGYLLSLSGEQSADQSIHIDQFTLYY